MSEMAVETNTELQNQQLNEKGFTPRTDETRKRGTKQILHEFCENTTAHGPGHVIQERITWAKVFWIVVFIGAVVGMLFHLSLIIQKYFSYPVQEVTTISQNKPEFPHVTICNQNPMSTTAFNKLSLGQESNISKLQKTIQKMRPLLMGDYLTDAPAHIDDMFASAAGYFENIGIKEARAVSHTFRDFVLGCTYAGMQCTEKDFEVFVHPLYFNCYTFTGKHVKSSLREAGISEGPAHGLSLVLYLESVRNPSNTFYNRYSSIGNALGARIQLHTADTYPRPDINGLDAVPGHSTSLAFSVHKVEKLGGKYGNCSAKLEASPKHKNFKYSSSLCFAQCAQRYIQTSCNCSKANLPFYGEEGLTCGSYFDITGASDEEKMKKYVDRMKCQTRSWKEYSFKKQQLCHCPHECHKTLFPSTMSESFWPAPQYEDDFFVEYISSQENADSLVAYHHLKPYFITSSPDETTQIKLIQENFLRVNVYFSDTKVLTRKQVPSYTVMQLLSDMGGTLGLWAGVSIITSLEVLGLLGKLCAELCKKINKKKGGKQ